MINVSSTGSYKGTMKALTTLVNGSIFDDMVNYGRMGMLALSDATPVLTGQTAASWDFVIESGNGYYKLVWTTDHSEGGPPVAILIQYGHGTGTGGYVSGRDFINPTMAPIFDFIIKDLSRKLSA